ncbi:hypothetical protein SEA_CAMBIARE_60 [Mycobacterium phage Cambiare]|uniref:Uncharacterized protein n=2 Tax=Avocadovirus TaxID=2946813 RepID=A0A222YY94_9CAUD|nr:hypothetical protein AVT48_gp60 [Mycobacterium phage Cambiare]YP_010051533.1 hypothetical protein KDW73_gp61 [Mycobacterium phage Avocado]AKF14562.1 hypothetical protein SEA_CAMBIARE_60 [Mycobacterium phage Cambiare]ASR77262.1 hypothetical protein SEA_AVOCADO_61 [Mycobacterium phage Avocado]
MTNTAKQYTVKITDGFEQNNRYAGLFDTKAEAIAASRAMKAAGAGAYCVCVPAAAAKTTPAALKMAGLIEQRTTDLLFADLLHLDRMPTTPETRLIGAAISDVITAREKIDAQLDAIFEDMEFAGTYRDAMLLAIAAKTATAGQ